MFFLERHKTLPNERYRPQHTFSLLPALIHKSKNPAGQHKQPTDMQTFRNDNFTQKRGKKLNFMARRQHFFIDPSGTSD